MTTAAQCLLLFMWTLHLSAGAWMAAKGRPERKPAGVMEFCANLAFGIIHLLILWQAGALSNLIGGAK